MKKFGSVKIEYEVVKLMWADPELALWLGVKRVEKIPLLPFIATFPTSFEVDRKLSAPLREET